MGSLTGTIFNLASIRQEGQAERAVAGFNRQVAQKNAQLSLEQGEQTAKDIREQTRRNISSARAAAVASGVVSTEGSPFLAQLDIAFEGEKQALTALRESQIEAQGFETEADFRTFEGDLSRRRESTRRGGALLSGITGAGREGLSLLSGIGGIA